MAIDHRSTPVGDGLLLANSLFVRLPPSLPFPTQRASSSLLSSSPRVTPNLPNVGAVGPLPPSSRSLSLSLSLVTLYLCRFRAAARLFRSLASSGSLPLVPTSP